MTLKLKECIKDGLVLIGIVGICYGGRELANYIPSQYAQRAAYEPMYPRARNKSNVEISLGASLVDEDGDGSPDRKTQIAASRQGFHRWNLPITEKDKRIFKDLTSGL
ncbi:MAG: hypothetical protein Q7S27_07430 [Nanoarchaeota archaeon]|nr:hypothetical protein [Nanoarchaeota archaeon]